MNARVQAMGRHLDRRLDLLKSDPDVIDIRSTGLLAGVELTAWPEGVGRHGRRVRLESEARGVLFRAADDTIALCPPLIVDESDLDRIVEVLAESIRAARQ